MPLGGPRWAMSNDLHMRISAAFCPGEQLLCGWLPHQGWQEVGAVFFLLSTGSIHQGAV